MPSLIKVKMVQSSPQSGSLSGTEFQNKWHRLRHESWIKINARIACIYTPELCQISEKVYIFKTSVNHLMYNKHPATSSPASFHINPSLYPTRMSANHASPGEPLTVGRLGVCSGSTAVHQRDTNLHPDWGHSRRRTIRLMIFRPIWVRSLMAGDADERTVANEW